LEENVLSFIHGSSQRFKDLLEALNVLSEEIAFTVNPEGLTAMQMDPSHCAMFILKMPSTAFERWNVTEEKKFTVDVTTLVKKILKNTYKGESVELSYDPDRERLDVILKSDMVRKKELPILETVDEEVPLPKIFFKAHARVVLKGLVKALKDFNELGEHTTITFENDSLTLSQHGDLGSQSTPFEKYGDNLIALNYEEDTKSTFTISYLEKIVRAIQPLSEVVNIELSTEMPIKISPELDVGTLDFYIAPCVGVGDDEPVRTETKTKEAPIPEEIPKDPVTPEEEPVTPEPITPEEPAIPTTIPTSIPIMIDMSILRRLKL